MPVPAHLKGFIEIIAGEIARQIQAEQREAVAKSYADQRESVMVGEPVGFQTAEMAKAEPLAGPAFNSTQRHDSTTCEMYP